MRFLTLQAELSVSNATLTELNGSDMDTHTPPRNLQRARNLHINHG